MCLLWPSGVREADVLVLLTDSSSTLLCFPSLSLPPNSKQVLNMWPEARPTLMLVLIVLVDERS